MKTLIPQSIGVFLISCLSLLPCPAKEDPEVARDRALIEKLEHDTFLYAWENCDNESGMVHERYPTEGMITTGGTGFGVTALIAGIKRGYITRAEGVDRLMKMTGFLLKADRFKGAFPHWYKKTGKVAPFGEKDDGGDLVETSFLIQGLLIAREYFDGTGQEKILRDRITQLWEEVDWKWYTNGKNSLLWHWSEKYGFEKNHRITGFNECMVTYILALASPTHPIDKDVYATWTSTGGYQPHTYNGYLLEAGVPYGGPLFFTHYSFIGLDGRQMADSFVKKGYFVRNINHVMINRAYCLENAPAENKYSESDWGLTASYGYEGYSAHSPNNDRSVISPTAALSSMPYTPWYSLHVLRKLDREKEKLWGKFGPCDAYSPKWNWSSFDKKQDYLAIDQLPITCMVENYRSGLLWKLFMRVPEVRKALAEAGISSPDYTDGFPLSVPSLKKEGDLYVPDALDMVRHPDTGKYMIPYVWNSPGAATMSLLNAQGKILEKQSLPPRKGLTEFRFGKPKGIQETDILTLRLAGKGKSFEIKIRLH